MKKPASFQIVTAISAGSAVAGLPSQLMLAKPKDAADLIEQAIVGRIEKQPDIGGSDHRQDGRREEGKPQRRPSLDAAVNPERHGERKADRDRHGDQRVEQIVFERRQKIGSASMARYWSRPMKAAGRRPCGVEKKLSMTVVTAGTCVKVASRTTAGSASSQPCTWMFSCGVRGADHRGRAAPAGTRMPRPACLSVSDSGQDARRLGLRLVERGLGRLGAGQHRLQRVVERLGDALIVVGRQFGDGVLELVARDQRRREVGRRISSWPRSPRHRAGSRHSRWRCPSRPRAPAW